VFSRVLEIDFSDLATNITTWCVDSELQFQTHNFSKKKRLNGTNYLYIFFHQKNALNDNDRLAQGIIPYLQDGGINEGDVRETLGSRMFVSGTTHGITYSILSGTTHGIAYSILSGRMHGIN
jgi:hypothetical protein